MNRSMEEWVLGVLLWSPLWWVLGINVFVYQIVVFIFSMNLALKFIRGRGEMVFPKPALWLALFLWFYFLSMLINAGNHPSQRLWASLNNYLLYGMGFLMMLMFYHEASPDFLGRILKTFKNSAWIAGLLTIIFVGLWYAGYKNIEFDALLIRLFPKLKQMPFFYLLTTVKMTGTDWFMQHIPRVSLYSIAYIGSGNFMVMILPGLMGYYELHKKPIIFAAAFAVGCIPLIFSLSRTAACAFVGAVIFVHVLERGIKMHWGILYFAGALMGASHLYRILEWMFNFRSHSTLGRMDVYKDAVDLVMVQNPLMGLGVRVRDGFSLMQIGSHSNYVELLLVTGVLGLIIFTGFQISTFLLWWSDRKYLRSQEDRVYWRSLGVGYIGANGTILTSSLSALPFIAYTYFILVSGILVLSKRLRQEGDARMENEADV